MKPVTIDDIGLEIKGEMKTLFADKQAQKERREFLKPLIQQVFEALEGGQDANLLYVQGHIFGIEHAWLEDAKTGTIYEVTVHEFYEVREYKDGVPQEWKTCKTNDDPQEYTAVVKMSFAEMEWFK